MENRNIKAWITVKHHHIPIYEGETKQDAINRLKEGARRGKETRPLLPEEYKKKDTAAFKAYMALGKHQDRVDKAYERLKTDDSPEAKKEMLNANRTLKEAQQRFKIREDAIKGKKQVFSYKFKKRQIEDRPPVRKSNEPDFQLAPEKEQKEFQAKYVNATTELYRDKSSGWVMWVKRRNEGASLYPYYSSYEIRDENNKPVKSFKGYKANDAEISKQAFEEAKQLVKKYSSPEPYKDILGPKKEVKDPIGKMKECHNNKTINPNWHAVQTGSDRYKWHNNCAICTSAAVLQAWGYDVEAGPRLKGEWRGWETIMYPKDANSKDNIDRNTSNKMPSGPDAATKKILKTVEGWGPNTFGELGVRWKHESTPSSHSVLIVNDGKSIVIWDSQTNIVHKDIRKYLSRTVCTKDEVHRLDNAVLKKGIEKDLEKMFIKRDTKPLSKQMDEAAGQVDWDKIEKKLKGGN